jgi:hypothetical protein
VSDSHSARILVPDDDDDHRDFGVFHKPFDVDDLRTTILYLARSRQRRTG